MAVLKRGLVLGAAALGGILLVAGIASASSTPSGGGGEDPYSPEACAAYKSERDGLIVYRNQLNAQLSSIESQLQAAADAGEEDMLKALVSARTNLQNQAFNANRRITELSDLIAGCS